MRIKPKTPMDYHNAEKPDAVLADLEAKHGSSPTPCSVERTSRDVIEHKLLTALEEGGVAALLSKQDLEDLVFACKLWPMRDGRATRLASLRRGMEQLLSEAFPPNDQALRPARSSGKDSQ